MDVFVSFVVGPEQGRYPNVRKASHLLEIGKLTRTPHQLEWWVLHGLRGHLGPLCMLPAYKNWPLGKLATYLVAILLRNTVCKVELFWRKNKLAPSFRFDKNWPIETLAPYLA